MDDEDERSGGSGLGAGDWSETATAASSIPRIALSPNGPWVPVGARRLGAAAAAAVGAGPARCTALVVDRRGGCVRGPCVLTSTLPLALEVRTVPIAHGRGSASSSLPDSGVARSAKQSASVEESVFESERFFPFVGWQEPKGQLDEFFTARFSRGVSGKASTSHFPDVPLPEGWRWDGAWNADTPADGEFLFIFVTNGQMRLT